MLWLSDGLTAGVGPAGSPPVLRLGTGVARTVPHEPDAGLCESCSHVSVNREDIGHERRARAPGRRSDTLPVQSAVAAACLPDLGRELEEPAASLPGSNLPLGAGAHHAHALRRKQWEGGILVTGGEGGIRTHGGVAPSTVFETARFNHSRTSPGVGRVYSSLYRKPAHAACGRQHAESAPVKNTHRGCRGPFFSCCLRMQGLVKRVHSLRRPALARVHRSVPHLALRFR